MAATHLPCAGKQHKTVQVLDQQDLTFITDRAIEDVALASMPDNGAIRLGLGS